MDLIDKLKQISERISKLKDQVQTEEATKNAFVLPFIQALGYEMINERLQSAIDSSAEQQVEQEIVDDHSVEVEDDGIHTTEEELIGFRIVQAILSRKVDPARVVQRDVKTYFGVLLDDNNRKPLCRLHFNGGTKYIGLFDEEKNEQKEAIESPQDIYRFSEQLLRAVDFYEEG